MNHKALHHHQRPLHALLARMLPMRGIAPCNSCEIDISGFQTRPFVYGNLVSPTRAGPPPFGNNKEMTVARKRLPRGIWTVGARFRPHFKDTLPACHRACVDRQSGPGRMPRDGRTRVHYSRREALGRSKQAARPKSFGGVRATFLNQPRPTHACTSHIKLQAKWPVHGNQLGTGESSQNSGGGKRCPA